MEEVVSKIEDKDKDIEETKVPFLIMDITNKTNVSKTNVSSIAGPMTTMVTTVPNAKHPWKDTNVMQHITIAWAAPTAISAIDGLGS